MTAFSLLIDGQLVAGDESFSVINPATEQVLADCPAASSAQLEQAVVAAKAAFPTWSQTPLAMRQSALLDAVEILQSKREELAVLLTQEQGKPLSGAAGEIDYAIAMILEAADTDIPVEVLASTEKKQLEVHHLPLGVIAHITPWNYPVSMAAKFARALIAGNTVVVKPSPYTPLSTLKLGEYFQKVFPEGVLNIISGSDAIGAALTTHPLVSKVSFTGSVATGKAIMKAASDDLKRLTLELGGNDPAIVFADVDVPSVAKQLFWGAFGNSGQVCVAIKRLYVHESIADALISALVDIAKTVTLGDGLTPDVTMGPLNNQAQFDRISELVEDAKAAGATLHFGGEASAGQGYFYPPTIVSGIAEGVRLVDEEQFGPALPVMTFKDIDEVIARANESKMGLGASVWTTDIAKGAAIAQRLEAGTSAVNMRPGSVEDAPFGGFKWSGLGREGGRWSLEEVTEVQTLAIKI